MQLKLSGCWGAGGGHCTRKYCNNSCILNKTCRPVLLSSVWIRREKHDGESIEKFHRYYSAEAAKKKRKEKKKKVCSNAQTFKPEEAILPQNLYKLEAYTPVYLHSTCNEFHTNSKPRRGRVGNVSIACKKLSVLRTSEIISHWMTMPWLSSACYSYAV